MNLDRRISVLVLLAGSALAGRGRHLSRYLRLLRFCSKRREELRHRAGFRELGARTCAAQGLAVVQRPGRQQQFRGCPFEFAFDWSQEVRRSLDTI